MDKFTHFLNPDNFKIDDRNLEDLILFVQNLSKHYQYFDLKNKKGGDWFDLFASDESFLLADISKFEIRKYDALRLSLTQSFDELSSEKEKYSYIICEICSLDNDTVVWKFKKFL